MADFKVPGTPAAAPAPTRKPYSEKQQKFANVEAARILESAPVGTQVTSDDLARAPDLVRPDLNVGVAPVPAPTSLDAVRVQAVEERQRDLERSLNLAQEQTKTFPPPEEAAKLRMAAAQRGIPFSLALLDPKSVEPKDLPITWDAYANNKPLADILLDPSKAPLVHDEADKLARTADLIKNPFPKSYLGKVWVGADEGIQRDVLYAKKGMNGGTLSPEDQADLEKIDTRRALLPSSDSLLGQIGEGIVQQGPRMLRMAKLGGAGALAAGAVGLVGGPGAAGAFAAAGSGAAILADNTLQAAGNVYAELTDDVGVPHNVAWPASILAGAVISGLDTVSFGVLTKLPALNVLRKIPAFQKLSAETIRPALRAAVKDARFAGLITELVKDAAVEGGTEVAQEVTQILTDYAAVAATPTTGSGSYRLPTAAEAAQRMALSGVVGAAAGAVAGGAGTAVRELALKVDVGEKSKDYIARIYDATDGLKSAERAPEVLREYVDKTAKSGPVQRVTLPGEQVVALAQKATTDEQRAFFARPDVARQIEGAQATGARVSLTLGEFVAYLRPLDEAKTLAQEIGLNDGMSPAEAKALSPAIEKAKKEMSDIGKRKELIENEPTSLITRDLEPKLRAAGMTEEGARVRSELVAAGVSTLAKRAGKDPFEVYNEARISVSSITHEQTGTKTLEQQVRALPGPSPLSEEGWKRLEAEVKPLKEKYQDLLARADREHGDVRFRLMREAGEVNAEISRAVTERIMSTNPSAQVKGVVDLFQASPQGVVGSRGEESTTYRHPESPIRLKVYDEVLDSGEKARVVSLLDLGAPETKENLKKYGGQGYSTALYLKALEEAKQAGLAFVSDKSRTDATEGMYARLKRLGLPFSETDGRWEITAEDLKKADLDAAWRKIIDKNTIREAMKGASEAEVNALVDGLVELQHNQKGEVRGRITFDPQARNWFHITLTEKANLSTFLHESSHYLLELMRKLDDEAGANSAFAEDLRALEKWAGLAPGEAWSVEALEKFARGMETYFGEGKAPSAKLVRPFATMKAWILHVYRLLSNLNAPLTDEVRAVMDRMLATQDEIDARRGELGYFPKDLVGEKGGMTPEQQATYRDLYERGARQAQQDLDHEAIAALRKEKTAEFKQIGEGVDKKLDSHPTIALRAWFDGKGRIDGGLSIPELAGKKLDLDAVKALGLPAGVLPKLREYLAAPATVGAIDPAELAPYFSFKNASEMLNSLASTPAREKLRAQMVKEEMTKLYPAYGPDKAWVEREALARLHEEDSVSNAIELELSAANQKAGLPPETSAARVAALAARENVRAMTREELDAQRWREAEGREHRAAQKAFAAKDFKEAAEATRKRLYARAMWREANEAARQMDSARAYAERFATPNTLSRLGLSSQQVLPTGERVGPTIRDAARSLVEALGLASKTEASDQPFAARISKLTEVGLPVLIDPASIALRPWETLSFAEALTARDALKNLSAVAKGLDEVRVGEEAMRLDEVAASVKEGLTASGVLDRLGHEGEKRSAARDYRMEITGPERIILDLDGGKLGVAHKLWMGSAERGQFEAEKRHVQRRDDLRKIGTENRPEGWEKLMHTKFTFTEGDGLSYTGAEVFAMLLNYGTETNRRKLVEGMMRGAGRTGWTYDSTLSFIHRVFPEASAYKYAQALLNYISSENLWGDSSKVAEAIYGVRPEKVAALAIPTPDGGSIEGGYYPLIRNTNIPLKELEATRRDGLDAMDVNPLSTMYAAHGFTEKRTGYVAPLLLDPTALAAHLYEVDHFITQAEGVLDRHKFLTHPEVKTAIVHSLGIEAWRELKASNNFVAAGGKLLSRELLQSKSIFEKMLFHNAILTMGGNVLSGLNQVVTGVPATLAHLGPKGLPAFAKTLIEFAKSPLQMWKEVGEESGEIAGMAMHYDRDLRIVLDRELTGEKWSMIQSRVATTTMTPVVFGQKIVNVLTFKAAKSIALAEGKTEVEAVAAGNSAVRLSQSSSAEKDITAVQRSDDLMLRALTSLASYTFALNNLVMPRRFTQKELAATTLRLTTLLLTTMATRALMDAVFPLLEEKDAERRKGIEKAAEKSEIPGLLAATQAMMDVVGNVPLVGRTAQSLVSGRSPKYASWVDTAMRAVDAAPDAFAGKGLSKQQLKAAVDTVGLATGIPTRHMFFAPGEFGAEFANGNIEDSPWSFFQELALARPGQKGEK